MTRGGADNSSVIKGFKAISIVPATAGKPSAMVERETMMHILFTAETHNFPTGIAPCACAHFPPRGRHARLSEPARGGAACHVAQRTV